jgi:integrase
MSIFKRGNIYWYHFLDEGQHVQKSTGQGNPRIARQIEAAHKTRLAKQRDAREAAKARMKCSEVLLCAECEKWFNADVARRQDEHTFCGGSCVTDWTKRHTQIPTLADFLDNRFEPWARTTFEKPSPRTWRGWYRTQIANIRAYAPLAGLKLDCITGESTADYAAYLQTKGWQPSSVNSSLRVLRRCLRLAVEWGVTQTSPKIKLLRGEHHRDRVVTPDEERKYLAAASELLADFAVVLLDSGMRPEENARLLWESVSWDAGNNGILQVTHGKTAAARRMLPLSPRVRAILERRWQAAGKPVEGWLWTADTASGHLEPSTVKKQHQRALRLSNVRPFVLYSLRHTFLTRLGAAGCDAWTLARIAGHSSIAMSARYVHPNADTVMNVFARMETAKALPESTSESVN